MEILLGVDVAPPFTVPAHWRRTLSAYTGLLKVALVLTHRGVRRLSKSGTLSSTVDVSESGTCQQQLFFSCEATEADSLFDLLGKEDIRIDFTHVEQISSPHVAEYVLGPVVAQNTPVTEPIEPAAEPSEPVVTLLVGDGEGEEAWSFDTWKGHIREKVLPELRKGPGKAHQANVAELELAMDKMSSDVSTWNEASALLLQVAFKQRHYSWSYVRQFADWLAKRAPRVEPKAEVNTGVTNFDIEAEFKAQVQPMQLKPTPEVPDNFEEDYGEDEEEAVEPEPILPEPVFPEEPVKKPAPKKKAYTHIVWAQPDPNEDRISGFVDEEDNDSFVLVDLDGSRTRVLKSVAKPPLVMVGAEGETLEQMVAIYNDLCESKEIQGSWRYIIGALSDAWKIKDITRDESGRFLLRADHMFEAFEKTLTSL